MLLRIITIVLYLPIALQFSFAQQSPLEDLKFENYISRAGLPSDNIHSITQDKFGFIWLGSQNGMIRFDGVEFKTYRHSANDPNSLPDNDAKSIIADHTGKIWLASRKGLFYYNYATDNFTRISRTSNGKVIRFASCPVLDASKNLWFYSNLGICRLNGQSLSIDDFQPVEKSDFPYFDNQLFSTRLGTIWYCGFNALYRFNAGTNSFEKQQITNNDELIFKEGIQDIFQEQENKVWIASLYGLYLFDGLNHTIEKFTYQLGSKIDKGIYISSFGYGVPFPGDSILWCSTSFEGLVLFNLHSKKFIHSFRHDNYDATSIGGSFCYRLFTGRDSILWISHINGLSKLDWHNQQIKSYRVREMEDSNRIAPIRRIIPDKERIGNYWLITWTYGVLHYNKNSNNVIKKYNGDPTANTSSLHFSQDGIYDNNGTLWVGSEGGLHYYNDHADVFKRVTPGQPLITGDTIILRMTKDNNNNLWLGTDAGLWKYNIQFKKFRKYKASISVDSSIVNSPVYAMHFDNAGKLFVGTHTGLYVLDILSGNTTALRRPVGNSTTDFNINYIWGIDVDKSNNVWVATRGGGLYQYNQRTRTYTDYKIGNGLTTEELRDVYIDSLQNVWVSSFDGIFKFDHETRKLIRYTPEDGLDNLNISLGRWSIIDNKIFSGSPGAYSIINPYKEKSLTSHFPVWITGVRVLNRYVHFRPDSAGKITVLVNYQENIISFDFTAINYTSSSKIKYAYMLDGFDKDWRAADNQQSASYNNLAGGTYSFNVKAMNAEGVWSDTLATVTIRVKPPFWETWWFISAVAIALSVCITFLLRKRIADVRKESANQQQKAILGQKLAETEMMALRTQMNPHFIFNCMNIIDGLIADDRKEAAQDFLQKFSKLIRLVLENSQHQFVLLLQDLEALKLYVELEAIRSGHLFKYNFDIDEELIEDEVKIPPLLIQPYVENAIIHGLRNKETGEAKLTIQIKSRDGKIFVTIEDNGIGRKKAMKLNEENKKPHEPIGMKVTGKRLNLLQMIMPDSVEISIHDIQEQDETGTRVEIILPYDLEFYP